MWNAYEIFLRGFPSLHVLSIFLECHLFRYNIIGHLKFCLTLFAGLLFSKRLSQMQMIGSALAFCGKFSVL